MPLYSWEYPRERPSVDDLRDSKGNLPDNDGVMGFPAVYSTDDDETLCARCASPRQDITGYSVERGQTCDQCRERIL